MTIAVGAISAGALIIGADSQAGSGYPGDFKRSQGKISGSTEITMEQWGGIGGARTIAISGAGDSAYLDVVKRDIVKLFSKQEQKSADKFEQKLKGLMKSFFADHVIPFSSDTSVGNLKPELIIAVRDWGQAHLWVTNLTTVREVGAYDAVAIGSGATWADSVLSNGFGIVDEKMLTAHVAHAIFVAKERAEGCGSETRIYALRSNEMLMEADSAAIRQLEDVFRDYRELEEASLKYLIGWTPPEGTDGGDYDANKIHDLRNRVIDISSRLYDEDITLKTLRARKPKPSTSQKSEDRQ